MTLAETANDLPSFSAWVMGVVGVLGVGGIFGVWRMLYGIKDTVADVRTDVAVIKTEFKGHGERIDRLEEDAKDSGKRLDQVYHTIKSRP